MNLQIDIDCNQITDWDTFFDVFTEKMGFPGFFGRNMNAWIDCMSSFDEPEAELTTIYPPLNGHLILNLLQTDSLSQRCPDIYSALLDCSAYVNGRYIRSAKLPILIVVAN